MGDITGDLSSRRGQIIGTDTRGHGRMIINGRIPLAELTDYQSRLNSFTGARGHNDIELSHYAAVPENVQQQLMAGFKLKEEED
jgi:elongation factor G